MAAALKCDVRRLPKPPLPPTRACRIDEKPEHPYEMQLISPNRKRVSLRYYTKAQDAVIRQMKAEGKTCKEIADELGRSEYSVKRRCDRLRGLG